jgi:hypothetical protein
MRGEISRVIKFTNRVHSLFGVALECSDSLAQHALIEPQIAAVSQHAKALVEQHPARGNITGQKTSDFLMPLTRREHRCHRFLKPRMMNCSGMPSSSTGRDGRSIARRFPRLPGFHRPGSVPRRLNGRLLRSRASSTAAIGRRAERHRFARPPIGRSPRSSPARARSPVGMRSAEPPRCSISRCVMAKLECICASISAECLIRSRKVAHRFRSQIPYRKYHRRESSRQCDAALARFAWGQATVQ